MMHQVQNSPNVPGRRLSFASLTVFLVLFLFSAPNLYADNQNDCLLDALANAPDSMTIGQLREQCRQKTAVSNSGQEVGTTRKSIGPAEVVLKTPQAKKPAFFPHHKHQEMYPCGLCHHGEDASGAMTTFTDSTVISKCPTCHNPTMPNKEFRGFQGIGHKLCRECHRRHQDITSATCTTCHRKELQPGSH